MNYFIHKLLANLLGIGDDDQVLFWTRARKKDPLERIGVYALSFGEMFSPRSLTLKAFRMKSSGEVIPRTDLRTSSELRRRV